MMLTYFRDDFMSKNKPVLPEHVTISSSEKAYLRGRPRPSTNTVTMADVAKVAGVSAQTVSRVLREPEGCVPATRDKVLNAVRATNYVQNLAASNLASNRSKTVAAVIPLISTSIFAETIQGLSNILIPAGYQIIIGHTDYMLEREDALVRSLLGRRPDAFVLVGTKHSKSTRDMLTNANIPVVETWDWSDQPIDQLIGFSNRQAFVDMVAHLRSKGRTRPVFVGSIRRGDDRAESRLQGYEDGMKLYFPEVKAKAFIVRDLPYTFKSGRELLNLARAEHPDSDAFMFSSDLLAAGALLACNAAGIAVPQQLAISGFGDYEISQELSPSLTTVSIPASQMGEEAARIILERVDSRYSCGIGTSNNSKAIEMKYQLMIRESA